MVTMHVPQQVDAVLFDMDGTLLDTLPAWRVASEHLWGFPLADADSAEVDGGTVDDVVELYLRDHPHADPQATGERFMDILDANLAGNAEPMPGADRLVKRLAGHVPIAVVSNSPTRLVRDGLASQGWLDLFDTVLGVDDVAAGKPAPDPYLTAARRLGGAESMRRHRGLRFRAARRASRRSVGPHGRAQAQGPGDMWVPGLHDERVTSWEPYR